LRKWLPADPEVFILSAVTLNPNEFLASTFPCLNIFPKQLYSSKLI